MNNLIIPTGKFHRSVAGALTVMFPDLEIFDGQAKKADYDEVIIFNQYDPETIAVVKNIRYRRLSLAEEGLSIYLDRPHFFLNKNIYHSLKYWLVSIISNRYFIWKFIPRKMISKFYIFEPNLLPAVNNAEIIPVKDLYFNYLSKKSNETQGTYNRSVVILSQWYSIIEDIDKSRYHEFWQNIFQKYAYSEKKIYFKKHPRDIFDYELPDYISEIDSNEIIDGILVNSEEVTIVGLWTSALIYFHGYNGHTSISFMKEFADFMNSKTVSCHYATVQNLLEELHA
jgi:hypothetical protein